LAKFQRVPSEGESEAAAGLQEEETREVAAGLQGISVA
jgi:hypothetical protein